MNSDNGGDRGNDQRKASLTFSQLKKIYKDQKERKKEHDKKKSCLKKWGCL